MGNGSGTTNRPLFQERLRAQIDAALLQKPADFTAFLSLMEAAGYKGQTWARRLPLLPGSRTETVYPLPGLTLGEGYGPEDIRAVIEGRAPCRPAGRRGL